MTIGVALPAGDVVWHGNAVDQLVGQARQAADAGLTSVWFSQLFQHDAITLAAVAGREVPGITVGTHVVPLYPRHPLTLASHAQTAQAATGGRFVLGVGTGVRDLLEPAYGTPYPPPIRHLRESLTVLRQALNGERPLLEGRTVTARPPLPTAVAGGAGAPLLVAAMGPQALAVTGELADGTLPFLAGPRTLAERIVPVLTAAAAEAARPVPRIVAAVPAVVTDDVDVVRQIAAVHLGAYAAVPSYRQVLAAEGATHPVELALIGDEHTVATGIRRYFDAGATEVVLTQTGLRSPRERERTWHMAGRLASRTSVG
ncbi:TIGR03564 family F420-dependent LLM class oxidoreductase [Streptomyces radicis]|uniref:TIGR03564 family F420-dependent LLM class oxidoreductase n=1 Tax=Streptomyces radicis TaxID=1750517 RepID=A0A3A9VY65_9ACTN|nr:TIGR03564 family F420-dependent LLM class oxidoreductase [Streptomyces radicis]RKN05093.1 TIGR03564 family F420-dependent LLM class oxidoreductase [Streptomyces radicis]RKN16419.1 TIGR03564 family F420-dependent LLM class oxidoreductase [Streptomyces radicis]